jgi:serine protease
VSQSPDIIVRAASVADPQAEFGEGSGTENDAALSDSVQAGSDHFVYVRALNRGGADAANASVDVYWSTPATLVTPNLWNAIGSTTIPSVPLGDELTVSDEIVWGSGNIPGPGHYCFVAVAGNALDPKPNAATFATFDQFVTYIENNNNVAWRNFDVVPAPPSAGLQQMRFLIPGAFDTSRRFDLESIGRLPRGSRVTLAVPGWLADALYPHQGEVKYDPKTQMAYIPLHPSGRHRLGTAVLHARSAAECVLQVRLPDEDRRGHYDFAVRQLYQGKEVGRLTWRFVNEKDYRRNGDKAYRRKA